VLGAMTKILRLLVRGVCLVGAGVLEWRRQRAARAASSTGSETAARAEPTTAPARSATPTVRTRTRKHRPRPARRAMPAAQPQDLDGGVTVAMTGHNPGLASSAALTVEELGVRHGDGDGAYGLSPSDVSGLLGEVITPLEVEGDAGVGAMPGEIDAEGLSWTDSLIASAAETGAMPDEDGELVARGRDDDRDVPVADRGAGGLSGL
jgi:hypothetical protein